MQRKVGPVGLDGLLKILKIVFIKDEIQLISWVRLDYQQRLSFCLFVCLFGFGYLGYVHNCNVALIEALIQEK